MEEERGGGEKRRKRREKEIGTLEERNSMQRYTFVLFSPFEGFIRAERERESIPPPLGKYFPPFRCTCAQTRGHAFLFIADENAFCVDPMDLGPFCLTSMWHPCSFRPLVNILRQWVGRSAFWVQVETTAVRTQKGEGKKTRGNALWNGVGDNGSIHDGNGTWGMRLTMGIASTNETG